MFMGYTNPQERQDGIFVTKVGFPTGVENMGEAIKNLMGGGLSQYMGGAWRGFKCCQKTL